MSKRSLTFRLLDRTEHDSWDAFVATSPQGSIYSRPAYLDCIGHAFTIGIVENRGVIHGGMVLTRNEVGVGSNPLLVKYLGVLYGEEATEDVSLQYAVDAALIEEMNTPMIFTYAFSPSYENWINFHWRGFEQTTQYSYRFDFERCPGFRERYHKRLRRSLKAAATARLRIEDVDVDTFIAVHNETYIAQNTRSPFSDDRLGHLLERFDEAGFLYKRAAVGPDGIVHAVCASVYDARSANLILHGSRPELRKHSGNALLIDDAIQFASKHARVFDFEGSMHERIEAFYRGFGAEFAPYFVISKGNLVTRAYKHALRLYKHWR